ncbi:MAG: HAMP domain-containing histidine kinase [Patescibacteria group bacterium]|nr:HAMP domain-containing histidine kinase [Patescibacteria group bacterium]
MSNISKQFAALVTNLKNKPFFQAKLKLTAYYTLGIILILIVVNILIYSLFVSDLQGSYEGEQSDLAAVHIQGALKTIIFTVNGLGLILIFGVSFYVAGRTLLPIEESYRRQKKFIADAAHELRTPIAVMKAGAETILSSNSSKSDYKQLTRDSLEELNFLSSEVNDLLFLARNDDIRNYQFTKIDLGKLVFQQIKLMKSYAQRRKVNLNYHFQDNIYIQGNQGYVSRMVVNLLKNGVVYNKPNGKVTVSLYKKEKQIILSVKDTGIGISSKDLPYIFDRFYKADSARHSEGAGLGLSIVYDIVKIHNGNIHIQSQLNKGTFVEVIFPQSA